MCGIAGFWTSDVGADPCKVMSIARRMSTAINHRGPDAEAFWIEPDAGLTFAHRRLSIQDLSPAGAQPMFSASSRFVIIFNGEIYNHHEIRADLRLAGASVNWRGHSDTETLLAAFEHWGIERGLQRAMGMFALAIWDQHERALYLARDRIGEKPLYYGWCGRTLIFGSELKALKAHPDFDKRISMDALGAYLRFSYVPWPHSIYEGIYKLPAATYIRLSNWSPDAASPPTPYWSLSAVAEQGAANPFSGSYDDAVEELDHLLGQVVSSQMISDVPLGAFLSGGVDSSTITALMQGGSKHAIRTFSIGFGSWRFNEAHHAREVAKHIGSDHTEFTVTELDALNLVPELPKIFDEPFADSSQLPTILLSRMTRKSVTVAMSGDGGDEVFGGYNRYLFAPSLWGGMERLPMLARQAIGCSSEMLQRVVTRTDGGFQALLARDLGLPITTIDRMSKIGGALRAAEDFEGFYREIVSTWPNPASVLTHPGEADSILDRRKDWPKMSSRAELMMALDAISYLPDDIMVKVDRSAMSTSLETRAPFLDPRIVEFAWRLPLSMKIHKKTGKRIIRDVLYKRVPKCLIERPKQGFAIPIDEWLRSGLKDWAESMLSPDRLKAQGLFDADAVREVWQLHSSGRDNLGSKLWNILTFQAWQDQERGAG